MFDDEMDKFIVKTYYTIVSFIVFMAIVDFLICGRLILIPLSIFFLIAPFIYIILYKLVGTIYDKLVGFAKIGGNDEL